MPKKGNVTYKVTGNRIPSNSQTIVVTKRLDMSFIQAMIHSSRVDAGGESSTDEPSRFPMFVRMLYGAISLIASFTFQCRFTWSQSIRSTLSCPDSSLSLSRCATLLRRHMGRATRKGLTWSVARHYNHTVSESHLKHSALPGRRQEPQCMDWGFCRLGVEIG